MIEFFIGVFLTLIAMLAGAYIHGEVERMRFRRAIRKELEKEPDLREDGE